MKFSAALAISGAAVASAAVLARDPPVQYCPVIVKTVGVSWIPLAEFVPAHTWTLDQAAEALQNSKPDLTQVFPHLNLTIGGNNNNNNNNNNGGIHVGVGYTAPAVNVPYPTGFNNFTAAFPVPPTGGLLPSGGLVSISIGIGAGPSTTGEVAAATASGTTSSNAYLYPSGSSVSASASTTGYFSSFSSASPSSTDAFRNPASVSTTGGAATTSSFYASTTSSFYASTTSSFYASTTSSPYASTTSEAGVSAADVPSSTSSSASATSSTAAPNSTTCTNPRVRVEWRSATDDQRDAFVAGISCLMNKPSTNPSKFPGSRSVYEDLTSLHQQVVSNMHSSGRFLVFHRFFVYIFETLLREQCSYDGPLIWWDERVDAGNFGNAPMFTERFFGEMPSGADGRGVCIMESGFQNYEPNLGPGSNINNPHCLSRACNEHNTLNVGPQAINNCMRAQNYNDFRQCAEMTFHAWGHNAVGSVMANVATSCEDPAFYLHHGYVDWAYFIWQRNGPTRIFEIGGVMSATDSTPVTPDIVLPGFGLVPDVTIADVLNVEGDFLCYTYDLQ